MPKASVRPNGNLILERRSVLGLSQEGLGLKAGVSTKTIGNIEKNLPTTRATLQWVAQALGVKDVEELILGGTPTRAPSHDRAGSGLGTPAIPEPLKSCLVSFDAFIKDRTEDFFGRGFVLEAINVFQRENPSGYFVIEGDPGAGKSAILAKYIEGVRCPHHFNIRPEGKNRVEQFLRNICAQLIIAYRLPAASLPGTLDGLADAFARILSEIAPRLEKSTPLVIAIDALDEVDMSSQPPDKNILFLPTSVHRHMFFVVTKRSRAKVHLVTQARMKSIDVSTDENYREKSLQDIRGYIEQTCARRPKLREWVTGQGKTVEEFIPILVGKSENNFMYLRYVLPAIEDGEYSGGSMERLPRGLEGYYEDHWARMGMMARKSPESREDVIRRRKVKIVYVLAECRRPVSCEFIAEIVHENGFDTQEVIDEWSEFLHVNTEDGKNCYTVYHSSFREFLHRKDIVQRAGITIPEVNALIAGDLWQGLMDHG